MKSRIRRYICCQEYKDDCDIEDVNIMDTSVAMHYPSASHSESLKRFLFHFSRRLHAFLSTFSLRSDTKVFSIDDEILLSHHQHRSWILKDGGEDFRYSDTVRPSQSDEVLKLKNIKKDASLKLFKLTNQERYEHVGPKVTSSQDDKVYKKAKRDCAWLMISRCSRSHIHIQVNLKEQAQA
ncbi:hypothetical protein Tco_0533394 [Tanacetum coccineum]